MKFELKNKKTQTKNIENLLIKHQIRVNLNNSDFKDFSWKFSVLYIQHVFLQPDHIF